MSADAAPGVRGQCGGRAPASKDAPWLPLKVDGDGGLGMPDMNECAG
jgi:hypothetical protein